MRTVHLRAWLIGHWQSLGLYASMFGGLAVALTYKLGNVVPGHAAGEVQATRYLHDLHGLLTHPVNAPWVLLARAATYLHLSDVTAGRLASAGIGFGTLVVFCLLVRAWHGRSAAVYGTLLFGLSATFLHMTRIGTAVSLPFLLVALLGCGYWLKRRSNPLALLGCLVLSALLLYVPGAIWLLIVGIIWQWRTIDRIFNQKLWAVTLGSLLFIGLLLPLGWAIYKDWHVALQIVAVPQALPALGPALSRVAHAFLRIFVLGSLNPGMRLGRLPLFDVLASVCFLVGGYVYLRQLGRQRSRFFMTAIVITFVLIGLGGGMTLGAIIPLLYIVVACGVGYLLQQWLRVFPRNPIARAVGITVVSLVVGFACFYQTSQYFVAWPRADETRGAFML